MRLLTKLLLPLMLFGVLFTSYAQFVWLPQMSSSALAQENQNLETHLDTIAESLISMLVENQLASIYENLDALLDKNDNWLSITLKRNTGDRLYPLDPPVISVPDKNIITITSFVGFGQPPLAELQLKVNNEPILIEIQSQQESLQSILFTLLFAFMILTAAVIWLIILHPLRQLANATASLAKGDYEAILPKYNRDEIGGLLSNFSSMRNALRLEKEKTDNWSKKLKLKNLELQSESEEREKAQSKIQHLVHILDNSSNEIYLYDAETLVLLQANQGAQKNLGYSNNELMSLSAHELKPDFTFDKYLRIIKPLTDGETKEHLFETRHRRKDGSFYPVEVRVYCDVIEGRPVYVELTLDIEQRKLAETEAEMLRNELEQRVVDRTNELMQARDAANSANRAKSAFLASMSHELRTPMNGVVGMVDVLHQTQLTDDQTKIVDTIRDSAFSLLSILNDILDFSKIEAGKLTIEKIPVSLIDVIESVGSNLASNATSKSLRFDLFIDPALPTKIQADPVRLRQILFNLLGNAIKFTSTDDEKEGRVTLRVERTGAEREGKVPVRFCVVDNGIGMSEAAQSTLFQAFTQADRTTTRRFGGSGLGLSITQRLVKMLDGEIQVNSKEGSGSEFIVSFEFPIVAGADNAGDLLGENVLIVEKNSFLKQSLQAYIEKLGADYNQVSDPVAADQVILQEPPTLVILGDSWSKQEQLDFVESIQRKLSFSQIPFLALSSQSHISPILHDLKLVWINSTPLLFKELKHGVKKALNPETWYSSSVKPSSEVATVNLPSLEVAEAAGRLILVAEDHVVNRAVIKRQLNMLGFVADMAEDGLQAMKKYHERHYGLLLTDLHMPEMDGLELTQSIRERESGRESHLPIVAITANAMHGEADRCYEAGMDDFLTKPLELEKLKHLLNKWLPDETSAQNYGIYSEDDKNKITGYTSEVPLDTQVLSNTVGDTDPVIHAELLEIFLESAREISEEMEAAWKEKSAMALGKLSHKLKSAARSMGAIALGEASEAMEKAAKAGDWSQLEKVRPIFNEKEAAVFTYLDSILTEGVQE